MCVDTRLVEISNSIVNSEVRIPLFKHVLMFGIVFLSDEPGLEFKQELVNADGTVYKGQTKNGNVRQGYGV